MFLLNPFWFAASDPLADIFAGGETGDYWRFDATNTDASALDDAIGTATGTVNGLELTQATGSLQPLLKEVDGQQCALFDGAGDRLIHNFGSAISQPGTLIISFKETTSSSLTFVLATGSGSSSRWQIGVNGSELLYGYAGTEIASPYDTPLGKMLVTLEANTTTSKLRVNGVESASGDAGSLTTDQLTIGELWNGTDNASNDRYFWGAFFIDRILTADEMAYVEGLMAADAGMDLADDTGTMAADLASIYGSGEEGDVWLFSPDNVDAVSITEATGIINSLVLEDGSASHLPRLQLIDNTYWTALFDGSSDRLFHTFGSTLSQPGTIIIAFRGPGANTNILTSGSSASLRWQISTDSSGNLIAYAGASLDSLENTPLSDMVVNVEFDGSSSIFRVNGSQVATGNTGTQGTNRLTVGSYHDGSFGFKANVAAVMIVDRALTTTERDDVEAAFAALLGISI